MHAGSLVQPALELLAWSARLYIQAAPWILGLGLAAAIGRAIQVGRAQAWPRAGYIALEVGVEAVRLLIVVVVIGLGDPIAGARRIAGLFAGPGRTDVAARLEAGWAHHWAEVLMACALFAPIAIALNIATFALAALPVLRRIAERAGLAGSDPRRVGLAIVLFLKNLTIIPFTAIWMWGVALYLAR